MCNNKIKSKKITRKDIMNYLIQDLDCTFNDADWYCDCFNLIDFAESKQWKKKVLEKVYPYISCDCIG